MENFAPALVLPGLWLVMALLCWPLARWLALPAAPLVAGLSALLLGGFALWSGQFPPAEVQNLYAVGDLHGTTRYHMTTGSQSPRIAIRLLVAAGFGFLAIGLAPGWRAVATLTDAGLAALCIASALAARHLAGLPRPPHRYADYPDWVATQHTLNIAQGALVLVGLILLALSVLAALGCLIRERGNAL